MAFEQRRHFLVARKLTPLGTCKSFKNSCSGLIVKFVDVDGSSEDSLVETVFADYRSAVIGTIRDTPEQLEGDLVLLLVGKPFNHTDGFMQQFGHTGTLQASTVL